MSVVSDKKIELFIDPVVSEVANRSIIVTGVARSGTTLVGNIIHSFEGNEYAFEPPALVQLFNNRPLFDVLLWKYHFEHYLYEDILMPMLAGRSLNFNSNDWSYIFNAKSCEEIRGRFDQTQRAREIVEHVKHHRVVFKLTNVVETLPFLETEYPEMKKVIVLRHPDEVVPSMMSRGWFASGQSNYLRDGGLKKEGDVLLPYSISSTRANEWMSMTQEERCYACYIDCYASVGSLSDCIVIDYHSLLAHPVRAVAILAERLESAYGDLTEKLVAEISKQKTTQRANGKKTDLRIFAIEIFSKFVRTMEL